MIANSKTAYTTKNFYFVYGSFGVVSGAFHDFESCEDVVFHVPTKPNRGKVTPTEFSHNVVATMKKVTNLHRMVSTCEYFFI